jgi:L-ascorbate metabolism protein UlaG (beta-lactamase superfamily)
LKEIMAKLTYLGHSTFIIEMGGYTFITDPFISNNPSSDFETKDYSADYILVTHGHGDHTLDLKALAEQCQATVISNFEIVTDLANQGYENGIGMNHGGNVALDTVNIQMVNAVHSSSFPDGRYAGNPAGFILTTEGKSLYFAGDTALMSDMKLFGELNNIQTAILPVGDVFTMGYQDACKAAELLDTYDIVGMHFDTFEPIQIDHEAAKNHFAQHNKTLILPALGESINTK